MRMRKRANLDKRMERCAALLIDAPETLRALLEHAGFTDVRLRSDGPQGGAGRLYIIARRMEHG